MPNFEVFPFGKINSVRHNCSRKDPILSVRAGHVTEGERACDGRAWKKQTREAIDGRCRWVVFFFCFSYLTSSDRSSVVQTPPGSAAIGSWESVCRVRPTTSKYVTLTCSRTPVCTHNIAGVNSTRSGVVYFIDEQVLIIRVHVVHFITRAPLSARTTRGPGN